MNTFSVKLLDNASATGDWEKWPGGRGVVIVDGSLTGATLTFQMLSPDGSSAMTVGTDTTFTAEGAGGFDLPPIDVRMEVTSGSPANVYAVAARVPS